MADDIPGYSSDFATQAALQQYFQLYAGAQAAPGGAIAPGGAAGGGGAPAPTPAPGAETPLYTPGPGPLSPGDLASVLGEAPASSWPASWTAVAAGIGSFFRPGARRPSQYERALRKGATALERALVNTVRRVIKGPPPPVISRSRALVPFVQGPLRFVFGPIGALLTALNPHDLGSGELTQAQRTGKALDVWFPEMRVDRRRLGMSTIGLPGVGLSATLQMRSVSVPDLSYIPQDRSIPELVREMARQAVENLLPPSIAGIVDTGPPSPQPRPVPQITIGGPGTTPAPVPAPQQPAGPRPRWGIGIGAIVAGLTVEALSRTSAPSPALQLAPVSTPAPTPAPAFNVASLNFAGGGWGGFGATETCSCGPRGPRRKCLERAPVRFSAGRRKGKAAGTKCIRYATRRS
ncbi:MAG TPA: hypothetical protein VJ924_10365 [Alphaproteobacteria bacterium]|nr:hypothetical protein [Alphaproteobacteria bacterium]